jgi:small subunit ribosomal protein S20
MAQHKSAKKRIRQTPKRTARNRVRMSQVKSALKGVEAALLAGDKKGAEAALAAAQPRLFRGVAKGVVHRNTAARKMSRLTKRVRALG